jgi:large subunit ribosomal protein L16
MSRSRKFLFKVNSKQHNKVKFSGKRFMVINAGSFYREQFLNFFKNKRKNNDFFFKKFKKSGFLTGNSKVQDLYSMRSVCNFSMVFRTYRVPCLISTDFGKCTDSHLETVRRLLKKRFSKKALIFKRIHPYKTLLRRTNEVRMGGGKGSKISSVVYPVYPGCILFEVRGVTGRLAESIFKYVSTKLPFQTKFVYLDSV